MRFFDFDFTTGEEAAVAEDKGSEGLFTRLVSKLFRGSEEADEEPERLPSISLYVVSRSFSESIELFTRLKSSSESPALTGSGGAGDADDDCEAFVDELGGGDEVEVSRGMNMELPPGHVTGGVSDTSAAEAVRLKPPVDDVKISSGDDVPSSEIPSSSPSPSLSPSAAASPCTPLVVARMAA